jgi:hypothetical protein
MAWTFYGILIKPADATTLTEVLFEGWYGFRDQAESPEEIPSEISDTAT